jgi:hypothetical protein
VPLEAVEISHRTEQTSRILTFSDYTFVISYAGGCYATFHSGLLARNRRNTLRFRARGSKSQEITL